MSKQVRVFYLTIALAVLILQIFTHVSAQDIVATVKVYERLPKVVEINGRFSRTGKWRPGRNISFVLDRAGIRDLGGRISDVRLFDAFGSPVPNRRMIEGEYLAEGDYSAFSYHVSVEPRQRPSAFAHVSWIAGDVGILTMGDLFPQFGENSRISASIQFEIPTGWKIESSEVPGTGDTYVTRDLEHSVFVVGRGWRSKAVDVTPITIAISGERQFADDEATQMAREIYGEYRRVFGGHPASKMQIIIGSLPDSSQPGQWYAETRGTTVTIMSSDMAFKTQSLQRLHEQLRHEMFHFWLPNGVNLKGNYDWFYEGFALYQSLKTGVRLNRIRFEDFLDTLSRAHRFDDAIPPKESLIDASQNRWGGGNDRVYARGMVVAFLCDIAMIQRSNGKHSIEDFLRKLYVNHRNTDQPADANTAVLELLRSNRELAPITDRYITGKERITWSNELRVAGIEAGASGLAVVAKPSGGQRAMLDRLGYNNWRKLSSNPK